MTNLEPLFSHTRVLCDDDDELCQDEGGGAGGRGRDEVVGGLGGGTGGGKAKLLVLEIFLVQAELQRTSPALVLVIFLPRRETRQKAHLKHCGAACQCCPSRDTRCDCGSMGWRHVEQV